MTGIEDNKMQEIAIKYGQSTNNQEKQVINQSQKSSIISQEAVTAAQDYISKVYNNAFKTSGLIEIAKRQSATVGTNKTNTNRNVKLSNVESEIENGKEYSII